VTKDETTLFTLSEDGFIERAFIYRIRRHLEHGGLCILPSDTSYALVGIPFIRGVTATINQILDKGKQAVPLTFATQSLAERFVVFDRNHLQLLDEFTPGPITIVAPLKKNLPPPVNTELINEILNTSGTVGVRFPRSIPESQISAELERPLTTSAILYRDSSPVKNFADALDIVNEGLHNSDSEAKILGVRRRASLKKGLLSTVVTPSRTETERFSIHREGAIPEDKIRASLSALDRYVLRDFEDWT
jgi:tRNA A37 threonylcarbamoyladenosine synthetase subunit TsaC/SUA5/YrdC